jgi:hypothetical protein
VGAGTAGCTTGAGGGVAGAAAGAAAAVFLAAVAGFFWAIAAETKQATNIITNDIFFIGDLRLGIRERGKATCAEILIRGVEGVNHNY